MSSKKFINDPVDVVEEMVQGVLSVHADTLVRLEGFTVLLHRDIEVVKQRQVVLLSGGGSGHEPAHAGFIGNGMLSGAILGGVFASPSIASILAAIRAAAGPMGVLLVVKNYTGDRINFGQAALLAQAEGIKVATVVVADDCALPEGKGITGGRGVAGTVFVHKVAGALAASGGSLDEVLFAAKRVASRVKTLGVALTTCTVPGTPPSDRLLGKDVIEIGLGIHGEPGTRQSTWQPADALAEEMVKVTLGRMASTPKKVALLVNNLGGTPPMEVFVMVTACRKALSSRGIEAQRIVAGPLMTSLEMQGVSVSLLPLPDSNPGDDPSGDDDGTLLAHLDSPTDAPGWPAVSSVPPLAKALVIAAVPPPTPTPLSSVDGGDAEEAESSGSGEAAVLLAMLRAACEALNQAEPLLTKWDQVAGDGDCGITFQRGAKAILEAAPKYPLSNPSKLCAAIADTISGSMGGTSGALLEIFFRTASLKHRDSSGDWVSAFCGGTNAVREIGGADAGYRTMLDALLPAAAVLTSSALAASAAASASESPPAVAALSRWAGAVGAAESGAESTMAMDALAGRSNYVNEQLLKTVPDPGAKAVAIALTAALKAAAGAS
mmetsp:Transcript_17901/g.35349  ORF Transcript_17901/g.35349 Transcript_17901/m.35349 type:complete len:607 (+) Transcript_17901:51-1871(+)